MHRDMVFQRSIGRCRRNSGSVTTNGQAETRLVMYEAFLGTTPLRTAWFSSKLLLQLSDLLVDLLGGFFLADLKEKTSQIDTLRNERD